ncbi:MAG: DNA/RNA non-specific endonuclease [Eubacteriaceae bacterium]|nr:DNA/RNA non-specific endonuclease [Eubacteriaceae bacterium]
MPKKSRKSLSSVVIIIAIIIAGLFGVHSLPELYTKVLPKQQQQQQTVQTEQRKDTVSASGTDLTNIQDNGSPYIEVDGNIPNFPNKETSGHIDLTELDGLGRCGTVFCCLGPETLPNEERGKIGMIKPSGWHTVKYDTVDGKYLYNRCHLAAFCLTGLNAEERNLITGTRYMNTEGMLPFENKTCDYIKETGNHVMYRVTPIFAGNDLVAKGVHMEAESVEDNGEGIKFNIFCYNKQPGIYIEYSTGESFQE